MIPVILDCDNTMGIKERDVDDGLALLYLLGSENIDLLAVTTTFGNSTIEDVYPNTKRIFSELNISIPLYRGAPSTKNRNSEAAKALVEIVNKRPNEITVLATGSMTNLKAAYDMDKTFFHKVKEIVMMGGIEKPLLVNGKPMNELNFASDSEAIQTVLKHGKNITIITGHICLKAVFNYQTYHSMENLVGEKIYNFIMKETKPWIEYIGGLYGMDGFCNWDAVAAVYLDHPELFDDRMIKVGADIKDLNTGFLRENTKEGNEIHIPEEILDIEVFNKILIDGWSKVKL